jgi:pseudouridine 5'-phosphatase
MSPAIRHVIFDLDGTLLDTEALYTDAARIVCARYGAEYTLALKRRVMGGDTRSGAKIVVEALSLPIAPAAYIAEREYELQRLLPTLTPIPHAFALIERLAAHGVPMAIATSGHRAITELKFDLQPFLRKYVTTVVCGDDERLQNPKPAPDIYLLAAQALGVAPESCAALEDSLNGVLSSKAAGMRTIALVDPRWGFEHAEFAPHATVVASLSEVDEAMLGLTLRAAHGAC